MEKSGLLRCMRLSLGGMALTGLGLCSCMSTMVQDGYWNREPNGTVTKKPIYVFGGAISDLAIVFQSANARDESSIGGLLIFDFPLSLAADVVLLPLCIYEQIERTTWKEGEFIVRLGDPDKEVRSRAASALGQLEGTTQATVEALTKALDDENAGVRSTAIQALGWLGTRSAGVGPAIVRRLGDPDYSVRAMAAGTLGRIGADSSLVTPALIEALRDPEVQVRYRAVVALAKTGGDSQPVIEALQRALHDDYLSVREEAQRALEKLPSASTSSVPLQQ